MNDGAWEIASGRLCADCVRAMWPEYIFAPDPYIWAPGICDRCVEQKKQTARLRYTMNKRGLEKRGLENGIKK